MPLSRLHLFKPGKCTPLEILMEEPVIWLEKYVGMTHDHTPWVLSAELAGWSY